MLRSASGLGLGRLARAAPVRRGGVLSVTAAQWRGLSSSSGSGSSGFSPVNVFEGERRDGEGNRVLYEASQELTCRVMLSAATFNLFYWSYYLATCAYYKDVVMHGVNLGGDPRWGFAGAFGTGLMFYVTQQYSHHAVSKCYETADGERLGFQMHNVFGQPGRKIECRLGNASMLDPTNSKKTTLGSSYIPLRVKGVDRNILIDETGSYFVEGGAGEGAPAPRLMALLNAAGSSSLGGVPAVGAAADKAKRVAFFKEAKRKNKQGR